MTTDDKVPNKTHADGIPRKTFAKGFKENWQTLKVARDERGVVTVTLNRPEKRNALSAQLIEELHTLTGALNDDGQARVVVLRGEGAVFCAGGDLVWMQDQIHADRGTRIEEATKLALMLNAWNTLSKPVIGVVHGGAWGGGVGLCCVCDVTLATDDASFGLTETKLGLIPATISPYVIARMGEGRARQVFMSARLFSAEEAMTLGVVSRCVSADGMAVAIEAEIKPYLKVAPGAVAASKALARSLGPVINRQTIDASIKALADVWETDEAQLGIAAFLTKTAPPWAL